MMKQIISDFLTAAGVLAAGVMALTFLCVPPVWWIVHMMEAGASALHVISAMAGVFMWVGGWLWAGVMYADRRGWLSGLSVPHYPSPPPPPPGLYTGK